MARVFALVLVVVVTMMRFEGVKSNDVTLFNEPNFTGEKFELPNDWAARLHGSCLTLDPPFNRQTSSIIMKSGCMDVFDADDCHGNSMRMNVFTSNDLTTCGWNNRIASYTACRD